MKHIFRFTLLLFLFTAGYHAVQAQGLGIGIDPPASTLHIFDNNANTGTNVGFSLEQSGAGDALLQYILSGGSPQRWVMGIDQSDGQKFKLASSTDLNTNAWLTVTPAGFVGLGVTNPDAQLELENAGSAGLHIRTTDNGLDYGAVIRLVEDDNFRGGYLQYDASNNHLIIGVHDPDDNNIANDVEAINISRPDGYVGIGTAAGATERLEVNGGILLGNAIGTSNGTLRYTGTDIEGRIGGAWTSLTSGGGGDFSNGGEAGGAKRTLGNTDAQAFGFLTNNAERITILSGGNVGIGNTNPSERLQVNGGVRIGNSTGTNNGIIRYTGTDIEGRIGGTWTSLTAGTGDFDNGGEAGGAKRTLGNTDAQTLGFLTNNAERVTILSGGNVGIGTTAPGSLLQVGEAGANTTLIVSGDNNGGHASRIVLSDDSNSPAERVQFVYDDANNRFELHSVNTEVIRIDDDDVDIQGNGVFQDNAFGSSEWVIGQAEEGDVVCLEGSKIDEDGKTRAVVKACSTHNCSKVVGVVIPKDQSAHHGNPDFDYLDKIKAKIGDDWKAYWKQNHIGIELTGFRMTKVTGPVKTGDILVSAGETGYAMATKKPGMGAIIGKAAQDFDGKEGEKGMVWARIHLQSGSNLYHQVETLKAENEQLNNNIQSLEAKIERLERMVQEIAGNHQENVVVKK